MFKDTKAFSSFSVNDIEKAKEFYGTTLGLEVEEIKEMKGLLNLKITGGIKIMVYERPNHSPATYTVLNFPVDNLDKTVDELIDRDIKLERYKELNQDEKGILRGKSVNMGPDIAWFTDPSGNIISVMET
jgi:catechol 2,3-dioxygenase-like lactoylglutathione lyase family enzyme